MAASGLSRSREQYWGAGLADSEMPNGRYRHMSDQIGGAGQRLGSLDFCICDDSQLCCDFFKIFLNRSMYLVHPLFVDTHMV